jgi:carbonic anhydrase/acetyltransferase-like protein (isoleucine patch superfamily)
MIRASGVYIMESALIVGDVTIGEDSSVWSNAVIRGDDSYVRVGRNTNIQDMCVIHTEHDIPVEIGDNVTVGHAAVVHCRRIGSNCIIGMGAMLLDNAEIGEYCIVAAGAVVTEGQIIPPRSLVMGVPGKVVRELQKQDIQRIEKAARDYLRLSRDHYSGKHRPFQG